MNYSFFKKPSVLAIVLIAIFSFTGFVYAKKAVGVLSGDKTNVAESKTETPQEANVNKNDVVAIASQDGGQKAQDVQKQETSSEKSQTSDTPTPPQQPKGIVETVAKVIVDKANAMIENTTTTATQYPLHKGVSVTFFWAGEEADKDNKNISNLPSAWDEQWVKHFGGIDQPKKRTGYMPSGFTPKENPFYFALPYNDFDENGKRKKEISSLVPWAGRVAWKDNESVLKNQWIKIIKDDKVAYAQWQDVGPFKEDDADYVFGTAEPKSKTNNHAGLDVSPAVHDMLGLGDIDTVDWQFVDANQVPDGPWKTIVTTSQINWK
jgi:hypothetical protein